MAQRFGLALMPRFAVALLVAAVLALRGQTASAQTQMELRVATTMNDSGAELFYAQDMGFFTKAGLKIDLVPMNNAGAIASAVISGALDIGQLSIPVLAAAHDKGLPFVLVAPSSIYSSEHPSSALVVLKSSPLKTAADLSGKTIAVRDITNIAYLGAKAWIVRNGGDINAVHFVEMPDSAASAALDQNRIDAASLSEPDLDQAVHGNDRVLAYSYDAIAPSFVTGGYFAKSDFVRDHAAAITAFADVMRETARWANHNQAASAKILTKYTKVEVVPGTPRVAYAESLLAAQVQPVIDAAAAYHVIKAPFPASDIFAPGVGAK